MQDGLACSESKEAVALNLANFAEISRYFVGFSPVSCGECGESCRGDIKELSVIARERLYCTGRRGRRRGGKLGAIVLPFSSR